MKKAFQRVLFRPKTLCASLASVLAFYSVTANASAFQLWEQDAASIGDYHAGAASQAADASTVFYNPAGMTLIPNQQLVIGSDVIDFDARFTGSSNTNITDGGFTSPVANQSGSAQGGVLKALPVFYYVAPISSRVFFGLGVSTPFGLETAWQQGSVVSYSATETQLRTVNVNPSLAFKFTDKFSMGFGYDLQYLHAIFDQDVPSVVGQELDENYGSDWGHGWNIGALYAFTPQTRVGISYRSQIKHNMKGNSNASFQSSGETYSVGSDSTSATFKLPAIIMTSLFHQATDNLALMASVSYVQWNVFKNLELDNTANPAYPAISDQALINISVPQHFQNAWNASVGAEYTLNEKWKLRSGFGYDQTPTSNQYRNMRLPDGNRFVIALGTHYQATDAVGVDAGWNHLFIQRVSVNNTQNMAFSDGFGGTIDQQTTVNGHVKSSADVFGMQVVWNII